MDEIFKKAVVDSIAIDPNTIIDKVRALAQYGTDIIEADPDTSMQNDKVLSGQAGCSLLLEKAEELEMSEADFLVFLLMGAMGKIPNT